MRSSATAARPRRLRHSVALDGLEDCGAPSPSTTSTTVALRRTAVATLRRTPVARHRDLLHSG